MSDVLPEFSNEHLVNQINQGRLPHAGQMIQYRQMLALESIARDLERMMYPSGPQLAHPSVYQHGDTISVSDPNGTGASASLTVTDGAIDEIGPALQHSRKRRQSGVPE